MNRINKIILATFFTVCIFGILAFSTLYAFRSSIPNLVLPVAAVSMILIVSWGKIVTKLFNL